MSKDKNGPEKDNKDDVIEEHLQHHNLSRTAERRRALLLFSVGLATVVSFVLGFVLSDLANKKRSTGSNSEVENTVYSKCDNYLVSNADTNFKAAANDHYFYEGLVCDTCFEAVGEVYLSACNHSCTEWTLYPDKAEIDPLIDSCKIPDINFTVPDYSQLCPEGYYRKYENTGCKTSDFYEILLFMSECQYCDSTNITKQLCFEYCEKEEDCVGYMTNPYDPNKCFLVMKPIEHLCKSVDVSSTFCKKESVLKCYSESYGYEEAMDACVSHGGYLAVPNNEVEVKRAQYYCQNPDGCYISYGENNCYYVDPIKGLDIATTCDTPRGYCCEFITSAPTTAPTGSPTQEVYFTCDEQGTFQEAQACCKSYGAELVSIHSEQEQDLAWDVCKDNIEDQNNPCGCWIGLNRVGKPISTNKNDYSWSDGTENDFDNFEPSEPDNSDNRNEECVHMRPFSRGGWNDLPCLGNCDADDTKPIALCKHVTSSPTRYPTYSPTESPTYNPTVMPTTTYTNSPTKYPTKNPTQYPTPEPTYSPTGYPTPEPTYYPTKKPTPEPTYYPTKYPTPLPTYYPTYSPTHFPTPSPTKYPTPSPTQYPTPSPTKYPTLSPTYYPTPEPTYYPTPSPTKEPTYYPTVSPTKFPTPSPTQYPTPSPTEYPTPSPTEYPTPSPTKYPTPSPTKFPTPSPTEYPTPSPTYSPTHFPTYSPTHFPTYAPTKEPTNYPTKYPTPEPTPSPTKSPTQFPTPEPTKSPTLKPSNYPTNVPTPYPTRFPTPSPTKYPTPSPTKYPTPSPTKFPTPNPTKFPTPSPTKYPTPSPTKYPTPSPTKFPTPSPTQFPTPSPTEYPTPSPTKYPTPSPTKFPTPSPTKYPTPSPTKYPTYSPTKYPTPSPTKYPTPSPTKYPTLKPTTYSPTKYPTPEPTPSPTKSPTQFPTPSPTKYPTPSPTKYPTPSPTKYPTPAPTKYPVPFPTKYPTPSPTYKPTPSPTKYPTPSPTKYPTPKPTNRPTPPPTKYPTPNPTKYPTPYPTVGPTVYPECKFKNGEGIWKSTNIYNNKDIVFNYVFPNSELVNYVYDSDYYPYTSFNQTYGAGKSATVLRQQSAWFLAPSHKILWWYRGQCDAQAYQRALTSCTGTGCTIDIPGCNHETPVSTTDCKCVDKVYFSDNFDAYPVGYPASNGQIWQKWVPYSDTKIKVRDSNSFSVYNSKVCSTQHDKCVDLSGQLKTQLVEYKLNDAKYDVVKRYGKHVDRYCTVSWQMSGSRRCGKNHGYSNKDAALRAGCLEYYPGDSLKTAYDFEAWIYRENGNSLAYTKWGSIPWSQAYQWYSLTADVYDVETKMFAKFKGDGTVISANSEHVGNFIEDVSVTCCCVELFDRYIYKNVYYNQGKTGKGDKVPKEKSQPNKITNKPPNYDNFNYAYSEGTIATEQVYSLGIGGSVIYRFDSGFTDKLYIYEETVLKCPNWATSDSDCVFNDNNEDAKVEISVDGVNFITLVNSLKAYNQWAVYSSGSMAVQRAIASSNEKVNALDDDEIPTGTEDDETNTSIPEGPSAGTGDNEFFFDNLQYQAYTSTLFLSKSAYTYYNYFAKVRYVKLQLPYSACFKYVRITDKSVSGSDADDGFDIHAIKTSQVCCNDKDADYLYVSVTDTNGTSTNFEIFKDKATAGVSVFMFILAGVGAMFLVGLVAKQASVKSSTTQFRKRSILDLETKIIDEVLQENKDLRRSTRKPSAADNDGENKETRKSAVRKASALERKSVKPKLAENGEVLAVPKPGGAGGVMNDSMMSF